MALKLAVPDTIRPFLVKTDAKSVYAVKDSFAWMSRRFAKLGMLHASPEEDKSTKYVTKILGLMKGKGKYNLIVDNFVPDPGPEFFAQPQPLVLRLMYVEWGFEVTTVFRATSVRRVSVKGNPAIELTDVDDVKVSLGIYVTSLGARSGAELGLFVRGGFTEAQPSKISLNKIWFTGDLPDDIGDEGLIIDKVSLKPSEDSDPIMMKLQAFPERSGGYMGNVMDMAQISKLANFIEQRWTNQAQRLATGQERTDMSGRGGVTPPSERKVEDYLKPHYVLLGNDEKWVEALNKFGVCVPITEKEPQEVINHLGEKRCDVIIGDADHWDTDALEIAQALRSHEKYSEVPLLWIAGPDNIFAEAGGQDLLDLGAYDFVDRHLPEEELRERFSWASSKTVEFGNGPALVIINPLASHQYRIGLALRREGIKVVKAMMESDAGVVNSLIEHDARWILVDGAELGDELPKVLKSCLDWALRGKDEREVMLIERGASEEQIEQWKQAGVHETIKSDPSLEEVKRVVLEHIESDLSGPDEAEKDAPAQADTDTDAEEEPAEAE